MILRPHHRILRQPVCISQEWVLLLCILTGLAVPTGASAQEADDEIRKDIDTPGLMIEAAAGWDGIVDHNSATSVALLITNQSAGITRGEIVLKDPINNKELSLGEVVIAPDTSRRLNTIQNLSEWYECLAEFRTGGAVLWRRDLPLNTGKQFFENISYVLFVDDGGRSLQLPGAIVDSSSIGSNSLQIAAASGRPVHCLTAKTWQVPNHHGPMIPVQALLFREGASERILNRRQCEAIGEWICQGGTLFLHEESDDLMAALIKAAPLKSRVASVSKNGEFSIRRLGLGAIYEYSQPLFAQEGHSTRKRIAEAVSLLPKHHIATLVSRGSLQNPRGGRADRNRILVGGFFVIYAFLSGAVTIMLFRLSQRKIGLYALFVVAGACVLSAVLGGMLRFSEGDLNWMTVTQPGAGGAVQVAQIQVQSAGGRNTKVAVKGTHADLQFTGHARRYYYWRNDSTGIGPFTWQRNQASGDGAETAYQIGVPMTPFGTRRLYGTGFQAGLPRLGFRIRFSRAVPPPTPSIPEPLPQTTEPEMEAEPDMIEATVASSVVAAPGTVTVSVANHLPFDLIDCWVVIGVSPPSPAQAPAAAPVPQSVPGQPIPTRQIRPMSTPQAMISLAPSGTSPDFYQMIRIGGISAGETWSEASTASFNPFQNAWDLHRAWEFGQIILPRLSRAGTSSAWFVGRLKESPILEIDSRRSDFFAHDGLHLYVQEILPDDIPDAAAFFSPPPQAPSADENEPGTQETSSSDGSAEPVPGN